MKRTANLAELYQLKREVDIAILFLKLNIMSRASKKAMRRLKKSRQKGFVVGSFAVKYK